MRRLRMRRLRIRLPEPRPVARPGWSTPPKRIPRGAVLTAIAAAALLLIVTSTSTLGATMVTPKCDDVRLRTGPSTTNSSKGNVDEGAEVTVVATVSGGSYGADCAGEYRSGSNWHKISAVNGRSVSSLYGVNYVYGATKLFKTLINPTPAPTAAPTAAPSAGSSAPPTTAPTSAPTTDPGTTPAPTATVAPTAPPPTATPGPVTLPASVTFHGRGWGHGVGLSQYGAQGRAADGQSAATILAHYFKKTVLGTMANKEVRVLVLQSFGATSSNPVQVYGRGGTWAIDGIDKTFPADARLRFVPTTSGSTTTWKALVTAADGTTLHSGATNPKIRVRASDGGSLQLWSKPSAHDRYRGVLRLIGGSGSSSSVNVVNELPMETYLRGVVPAEISPGWPTQSIRAQAIAARSYAAYRLHPDRGTFDFYDDTRSQVYFGKLEEEASTDAAIAATAGVVVRTAADGTIANTLFHSAGGGATEHNDNVYVSSTGEKVAGVYSYLRGSMDRRPDGTAYDSASPNAKWKTATYTRSQIQSWFAADSRTNVGTVVALDLRNRGVSRLISVTLIGANGSTKKVSADVFRSIFNAHRPYGDPTIRSSLFDLAPIP